MAQQKRVPEPEKRSLPVLFCADGYKFPDVYHVTRFLAPDPIIALEQDGEVAIVVNSLEEGRARKQSRAREVLNIDHFGAKELLAKGITREDLDAEITKRFLESRGLRLVAVPPYFPLRLAEFLRANGIELVVAADLAERRRAKRPDEIAALEATQRATEDAWARGVDGLKRASVRSDGTLELDGEPFTAERLRAIVEDIFPQHKATRYFADMTRTDSKGPPPAEIAKLYEVTKRAQDAGINALRPGVMGRDVHAVVEDVIWDAGYDTLRPGQ